MKALRALAATVAAWATALAVQAAPPLPPASLTVSAEQGQQFGLALDGRALTWPVARQVRAGQLAPGWHRADVSLAAPYGPPVRFSTRVWLEAGRDNNYVLVLRRSGPQMLPVAPGAAAPYPGGGQYPPPGPAYPGGGAYPAPSTPAPGNYPGGNGYPGNGSYPGGAGSYPAPGGNAPATPGTYPAPGSGGYPATPGTGNNYPAPGGNGYPAPGTGSYPSQPAPGNNYPGGNYPGGNGYPGGNYPGSNGGYYPNGGGPRLQQLTPAEVARLQQSVSQRSFDDDRLAIIKQALSTSAVRADELTTLVRTLSFDRSRVELAKFGYAHVSDQQNFYRVYEALQYSSSVREVQDALGLPR